MWSISNRPVRSQPGTSQIPQRPCEQRGAEVFGAVASEVGDGSDVDAVSDHDPQERVVQQLAHDTDWDRSDALELAQLTGFGVTSS